MSKESTSISPNEMGRAAFRNGEPRFNNPFLRGTPQFVAWLRGYNLEKVGK